MTLRHVSDLVRQDAGELGFVPRRFERAAIHPYRSTWQREGVDLAIIRDGKAVRIARTARVGSKPPPDARHVRLHGRVTQLGRLPPDFRLRLPADRDFVGDGHELNRRRRDGEECNHNHGPADRLRQGYGGPPTLHAKAEAGPCVPCG